MKGEGGYDRAGINSTSCATEGAFVEGHRAANAGTEVVRTPT